ncbi:MAG: ATP-binding protein, partial [Ktedonobacteraceae bacterium]
GIYPPADRLSVSSVTNIEEQLASLRYLFFGREARNEYLDPIRIGSLDDTNELLSIAVRWYIAREDESGIRKLQLLQPGEYTVADNPVLRFAIRIGVQSERFVSLAPSRYIGSDVPEITCIFRRADGTSKEQIAKLWDNIALTELEKDILSALRIIAPGAKGLNLRGDPRPSRTQNRQRERFPIIRVGGFDEPIPLRSLGDGMMRTLATVLALVNAKDGILLIDEFENGFHYSVLPELWQMIFQVARRLNVQVFATTHSWDCIESFQKVAAENKQEEGLLMRLSLKGNDIVATIFDENELGIITRERIEVR